MNIFNKYQRKIVLPIIFILFVSIPSIVLLHKNIKQRTILAEIENKNICTYYFSNDGTTNTLNLVDFDNDTKSIPVQYPQKGIIQTVNYCKTIDKFVGLYSFSYKEEPLLVVFDESNSYVIELPIKTQDLLIYDSEIYLLIKTDNGYNLEKWIVKQLDENYSIEKDSDIAEILCVRDSVELIGKIGDYILWKQGKNYYYEVNGIRKVLNSQNESIECISSDCYVSKSENVLSIYRIIDNELVLKINTNNYYRNCILIDDTYLIIGYSNKKETMAGNSFVRELQIVNLLNERRVSVKFSAPENKLNDIIL